MEINAGKLIGMATAAVVLIPAMLWGVPYYINSIAIAAVDVRMAEIATDPSEHPTVVSLITEVDNIEITLERVEGKVDAFSSSFMEYLERQAAE